MYIDIALAIVAILCGIVAVGIWWERAASRRKRAMHARRQAERELHRVQLLKDGKIGE